MLITNLGMPQNSRVPFRAYYKFTNSDSRYASSRAHWRYHQATRAGRYRPGLRYHGHWNQRHPVPLDSRLSPLRQAIPGNMNSGHDDDLYRFSFNSTKVLCSLPGTKQLRPMHLNACRIARLPCWLPTPLHGSARGRSSFVG